MSDNRFTLRLDADLYAFLMSVAEEKEMSLNEAVCDAVRCYRDYCYMNGKANFINDDIRAYTNALVAKLEGDINDKSNQLLSSMARELYVIQRILADNLEVRPSDVADYTAEAIAMLSQNNRVFRFDEVK